MNQLKRVAPLVADYSLANLEESDNLILT